MFLFTLTVPLYTQEYKSKLNLCSSCVAQLTREHTVLHEFYLNTKRQVETNVVAHLL